jgi:hypothetical protein
MKKITALFLTALFVVCGVMTQSARAEHFGPVRSFLTAGELSLGVGGGVLHDTWAVGGDSLFRQKTAYVKGGFGLGSGWALGLRGGVVDIDSVTGASFSSSPVPFVGASVGGPIYQGRILSLGPVVQASYVLKPFDDNGAEIEDMIKASAAFMAQLELEGASLYFGPTLSFGDATAGSSDLELSKRYAGVVGIRWRLPDNWPKSESKTFLDLEIANHDFQLNRSDLTVELNFTF